MEREGVSALALAPDAVPFAIESPGAESSMSRSWPRPPARTGAEVLNAGEGPLLLLFETLPGTEADAVADVDADGRAGAGVRNMVVAARKEAEEDGAELGAGLANTVTNTVCVLACVSFALADADEGLADAEACREDAADADAGGTAPPVGNSGGRESDGSNDAFGMGRRWPGTTFCRIGRRVWFAFGAGSVAYESAKMSS